MHYYHTSHATQLGLSKNHELWIPKLGKQELKNENNKKISINKLGISNEHIFECIDLFNNNFILEEKNNYFCTEFFLPGIKYFNKYYNVNLFNEREKVLLDVILIDKIEKRYLDLINKLKVNGKLIFRLNIYDDKIYDNINKLNKYFSTKVVYIPLINQIYNNYLYVIYIKKTSGNVNGIFDIKKIIINYLINNKIPLMYYKSVYGDKIIKKKMIKTLLNEL